MRYLTLAFPALVLALTGASVALSAPAGLPSAGRVQVEPLRAAVPATPSPAEIIASIDFWSEVHSIDPNWMLRIAECESGLDAGKVGSHGEIGPMQFEPVGGIWDSTEYGQRGIGPADVSVDEQIRVAAWLMATGHADAWTCA